MGPESRENGNGVVALTIPARAEYIALCRLALTGVARTRALQAEVVADLKLALTEACSNSVRHAYEEGRDGVVQISYQLATKKVEAKPGATISIGRVGSITLDDTNSAAMAAPFQFDKTNIEEFSKIY